MDLAVSKKLSKYLWIFSFGLSALFLILARLYTVSCADIIFMYTIVPELLSILVNVVECLLFGIAFAIWIYAAYQAPKGTLGRLFAIYTGSVFFKYVGNYILTWITDTGMSPDYLLQHLTYILIFIAIELLQAGIVLLIIWKTMSAYHVFLQRQMRIAANVPGAEINARTYVFPFSELISLKNPLQKNAFWCGCVISIFKVVSRLISDISYGWPASIMDAMWMFIYYFADLFVGFAVCLLITYLLITFDHRTHRDV